MFKKCLILLIYNIVELQYSNTILTINSY